MDRKYINTKTGYIESNTDNIMIDNTVEQVREDLLKRSQVGIKKYGVTLDRTDLSLRDFLQHALEEAMDFSLYIKRVIIELDKESKELDDLSNPENDYKKL